MTPTEKLQRLIEIANKHCDLYSLESYEVVENWELNCYDGEPGLAEKHTARGNETYTYQLNTIIFNKDFIKALCKAKYGYDEVPEEKLKLGDYRHKSMFILANLACSTNRIDYLWQIFGGEK